ATYAAAPGTAHENGLDPWEVDALYYSEPTFPYPERNGFNPNVWVDITAEYELKLEGLRVAWSHGRLDVSYPLCASFRGYQARLLGHNAEIQYAEAYVCDRAWVGD